MRREIAVATRILVTQPMPEEAYTMLERVGRVDGREREAGLWSQQELLAAGMGHDYILSTVADTIDRQLLESWTQQQTRVKLVANMAVGYNNIDVEAATKLGVLVTNTPGVLTETTADLAFALLLATARRMGEAERYLRAGNFKSWQPLLLCGVDVHHATLGIIGTGRIGREMVKRANGFDMHVLYWNRHRLSPEEEAHYHLTYTSLQELLQQSDFVSLHVPYNASTHHLLGQHELASMKPTAIVINSARGPVIDERALVHALQQGTILGAGLDVFEGEPEVEPELLTMENVVLLPHIGSASIATRTKMALRACENIVAHAQVRAVPNLVNPDVLSQ
jgi:glyoxylate reductase